MTTQGVRITAIEAMMGTLVNTIEAQGAAITQLLTQGVPSAPKASAKPASKSKAKKAKAAPKVKCSIKAHTSKTCDPKARFWSAKGAGEHVAKLDRSSN